MERDKNVSCKVCGGASVFTFEKLVLNKHQVKYFQCSSCQFIQTEEPYWLEEAYSSAITALDIGLLQRNLRFSPVVHKLISRYFDSNKRFLDYGGGYGLFVRMMRDQGLDFYRYDKHCENIFAQYFDIADLDGSADFELVTAFEVFEHLENPIEDITRMLEFGHSILFSTHLVPDIDLENWWYLTEETGQHIALFSLKSLQKLSNRFSLNLYTNGADLHLLTMKDLPSKVFQNSIKERLLAKFSDQPKSSLLMRDYQYIRKRLSE